VKVARGRSRRHRLRERSRRRRRRHGRRRVRERPVRPRGGGRARRRAATARLARAGGGQALRGRAPPRARRPHRAVGPHVLAARVLRRVEARGTRRRAPIERAPMGRRPSRGRSLTWTPRGKSQARRELDATGSSCRAPACALHRDGGERSSTRSHSPGPSWRSAPARLRPWRHPRVRSSPFEGGALRGTGPSAVDHAFSTRRSPSPRVCSRWRRPSAASAAAEALGRQRRTLARARRRRPRAQRSVPPRAHGTARLDVVRFDVVAGSAGASSAMSWRYRLLLGATRR
jgi:hypothetical protein